jgi:hypothetical protein
MRSHSRSASPHSFEHDDSYPEWHDIFYNFDAEKTKPHAVQEAEMNEPSSLESSAHTEKSSVKRKVVRTQPERLAKKQKIDQTILVVNKPEQISPRTMTEVELVQDQGRVINNLNQRIDKIENTLHALSTENKKLKAVNEKLNAQIQNFTRINKKSIADNKLLSRHNLSSPETEIEVTEKNQTQTTHLQQNVSFMAPPVAIPTQPQQPVPPTFFFHPSHADLTNLKERRNAKTIQPKK